LIDRKAAGERALLVHPEIGNSPENEDLEEFRELVRSAGIKIVGVITAKRDRPDAACFIGSGKVDEVAEAVRNHQADLVLINHALSPVQERNLERSVHSRVHDRTTLILDIFAQRARSYEGKLQVELAQLRHLSTRLVRGWTHLERQKGGIGLRGPGETQLETDRRLLANRVKTLRKRLDKVGRQRAQSRRARQRNDVPVVSLVGYTNAGKSTLFNQLTESDAFAADQLFATLDPTLRRIEGLDGRPIILADTVGFIRRLPHELVAAFRSTLQESREADLLLHVIDASDPNRDEIVEQVESVLEEIGADEVPQVLVFNKIDRLELSPRSEPASADRPGRVWVSALHGKGLSLLREMVAQQFANRYQKRWIDLPAGAGRLRARLFEIGSVLEEQAGEDGGWRLRVELSERDRSVLAAEPNGGVLLTEVNTPL
jgi:GTP-binding protein HflX